MLNNKPYIVIIQKHGNIISEQISGVEAKNPPENVANQNPSPAQVLQNHGHKSTQSFAYIHVWQTLR